MPQGTKDVHLGAEHHCSAVQAPHWNRKLSSNKKLEGQSLTKRRHLEQKQGGEQKGEQKEGGKRRRQIATLLRKNQSEGFQKDERPMGLLFPVAFIEVSEIELVITGWTSGHLCLMPFLPVLCLQLLFTCP